MPLSDLTSARQHTYLRAAANAATAWYDADGNWIADTTPAATRERYWLSLALYAAGDNALADAIIRRGETHISHLNAENTTSSFDIFHSNIATALLVAHRQQMAPDVREKLEFLSRESFGFGPGDRQPDYQFHGYNDNMPAKAAMGLILGGELLGDAGAVEHGLWSLRQLRAQLARRGINSEYNSPTYSPLTIHAMSEIKEHARNAQAREIAGQIEERLWIDLAARFHPETGVLAGPYARAYTCDTLAHLSSVAGLLWFVLGEEARPSPLLLFEPDHDLVLHHQGDVAFNVAQLCWYASGAYHVPDAARELFARKQYPFRAAATFEEGDAGPDFPAHSGRIETFLRADFTLGTSDTLLLSGEQTMGYFVTYKQRETVESFRDVGTVFTKMVVNDDAPGFAPPTPFANCGEQDNLDNRSNWRALQSDATALVLTHPHLSLGGQSDADEYQQKPALPLSRLSELVIFPSHFHRADEIIVGGAARATWSGAAAHGEWIVCRRGCLLVGVRPLAYSRLFGHARITLETANDYQFIRTTFYGGEPRVFSRNELRGFYGGFVAQHASTDDFDSLQEFADELAAGRFSDFFWTTRRVRYLRAATAHLPALDMETSWSPGSATPRFATVNGQIASGAPVEIDGVEAYDLPFLNGNLPPNPPYFPWEKLEVAGQSWPGFIGDRDA